MAELAPTERPEQNSTAINWLNYPDNLGVAPDLQHYVLFYINVRGKSKFNTENRSKTPIDVTGQNRLDPNSTENAAMIGKTLSGAGLAATVAGGTALYRLGAAATGAAAAAGISTTAKSMGELIKPDQSYRISDVIALHLDERPSVKYGAQYENKEVGSIMGGLAGGSSAIDSALGTRAGEAMANMLMRLANAPGAILGPLVGPASANPGDVMGLSAKIATNPFREVFFQAMDYRTFAFKYRFFPKSADESKKIKDIIDTFKFHMHPELSAGGLFYIYPSEFDIVYSYKGQENNYWHKISTCVLKSMDVDYGSDNFNSFSDGAPVEINMSLVFQEIEVLTKERMKQGY